MLPGSFRRADPAGVDVIVACPGPRRPGAVSWVGVSVVRRGVGDHRGLARQPSPILLPASRAFPPEQTSRSRERSWVCRSADVVYHGPRKGHGIVRGQERRRRTLGLLSRLTRDGGIALATERSFRFRVQRQESDLRGLWTGIRVHCLRAGFLLAARLHRAAPLPLLSRQPQGCPQQRRWRQLV